MSRHPKIIQLSNAYILSRVFSLIQERQHGKCRSCGIRFVESDEIVSVEILVVITIRDVPNS
jgi:hypothetical protein